MGRVLLAIFAKYLEGGKDLLGVTTLLCGKAQPGDVLRYDRDTAQLPAHLLHFSRDKKPIVVWNTTRRCNLHCVHCYASAQDKDFPDELTTQEGLELIDKLAEFGVPTILFSGGEPFIRVDLCRLIERAVQRGIRTVISTNGTLITRNIARKLKEIEVSYVGVSMDGTQSTHDLFRGHRGAFEEALQGLRYCREAGVRTGLRFTLTKRNQQHLGDLFDLVEEEDIPRFCVYHLAYAGRGSRLIEEDLTHKETRRAVDLIFDRTMELHRRDKTKDVLTVDNHADGVYLYMRVKKEQPQRAPEVYQLLEWNGGNGSGMAIAAIDNTGNVHADQFWWHYSFGNVRERSFGDIWTDTSDTLMAGLKNKKEMVKGRCSQCRYLNICGGNLRVRAEAFYGDVWAPDPACYLTDAEIGVVPETGGNGGNNGGKLSAQELEIPALFDTCP